MNNHVFSGQLNARVEFFENTNTSNDSGEVIESKTSLGFKMTHRIDAVGDEDNDGRLLGLSVCRFQLRFDAAIFTKASELMITDFDGDWDVVGPARLLDARRRYIELRCRKRGES